MNNNLLLIIFIVFVVFSACSRDMELRVYPNTVFLEAGEPGDIANVELQISNTGTAPMLHVRLRPQCACYTLASFSETIAPGESKRFNFAFPYPSQPGEFRERIQVEGASHNGEFVSLSELVVQGKSQRSFVLAPSIIDIEVSEQVGVVNATFLIKLLAESTWTEMEVIDITTSDVEMLSEAMTVSLASVEDGRAILGQCRVDLSAMDLGVTRLARFITHCLYCT